MYHPKHSLNGRPPRYGALSRVVFTVVAKSVVAKSVVAMSVFGMSLLPIAGSTVAMADDATIVAIIDQARLVKLPPGAQTLILGNPTVADVTLLRQNNMMVLTPKAFGETNFIALDAAGTPIAQSMIQVINGASALVVQRGMDRQSYFCAPKCQPIERLGDDDKYLGAVAAAAQSHTARLSGTAAPIGPGILH